MRNTSDIILGSRWKWRWELDDGTYILTGLIKLCPKCGTEMMNKGSGSYILSGAWICPRDSTEVSHNESENERVRAIIIDNAKRGLWKKESLNV